MGVKFDWVKHLEDRNDRREFEKVILSDSIVLGRLLAILDEMEQEVVLEEISPEQFENINWTYKRAYNAGDIHRIRLIKDLLSHLKDS